MAEWSKALVLGTSPKGRGFESHHCQIFYCNILKRNLETPGIEPGTSRMRSERSTTELHPLQLVVSRMSEFFITRKVQAWPSGLRREMSAVVAEWLRRLTRNQFPSGSAGSNPADCENFLFSFSHTCDTHTLLKYRN